MNQRRSPQLSDGLYLFNIKCQSGPKIHWSCSKKQTTKCRAKVLTVNDQIISVNLNHVHPPNSRIIPLEPQFSRMADLLDYLTQNPSAASQNIPAYPEKFEPGFPN